MTKQQFYYCLSRIVELRKMLKEAGTSLKVARAMGVAGPDDQANCNYESLQLFADNKAEAGQEAEEARALVKELVAQEAKIKSLVPVSFYGNQIEATQEGQPPLYVTVKPHRITIKKVKKQNGPENNGQDAGKV